MHYTLLGNDTAEHWSKFPMHLLGLSHLQVQSLPNSLMGLSEKITFLVVVGLRISVSRHVGLSVGQLTHNI